VSDEVVTTEGQDESQDAATEQDEAPATPAFDEATWKKRLAGKDQALTAAQKERDALRKEFERVQSALAEREQADLSEVERLQRRIQELETESQTAKREAKAIRLAKDYPLAFDLLGEDAVAFDEVRLAEINGRLKEEAEEPESEPRVDPNSPRKNPPARPKPRTVEDIKADLRNAAFPGT
jgi:seryl-tRNA synthetase